MFQNAINILSGFKSFKNALIPVGLSGISPSKGKTVEENLKFSTAHALINNVVEMIKSEKENIPIDGYLLTNKLSL